MKTNRNEKVQSPWSIAFGRLYRNKVALLGAGVLILMALFCFVGPLFSPHDIIDTNITQKYKFPGQDGYLLGTDMVGRDVLTRLMVGGRISLTVGIVSVIIQLSIGVTLGGVAGFYGGGIDTLVMRIVDIFMSIPTLPVLILLSAILSDYAVAPELRIYFVMLIIGILGWPSIARFIRGQILSLREQEFMLAAEALGLKDARKIFRHLIPNVIPHIIVQATLGIGAAILTESALSFLGLGVTPPYPSWGNMIQVINKMVDFKSRPWLWVPPGLCIFLTVMAINLLGDGLRDAFDPKLKR